MTECYIKAMYHLFEFVTYKKTLPIWQGFRFLKLIRYLRLVT